MGKLNPADAYRKEQKKKVSWLQHVLSRGFKKIFFQDIKKAKKEREKVREVTKMLNNPEQIEEEVSAIMQYVMHSKIFSDSASTKRIGCE